MADEVLLHGLKSISELVTVPGLINLDFADVKTIMSERGMAFMGIGIASGEDRAKEAARKAISSPLLEDISISGARGLLINIAGSSTLSLHEVDEAVSLIQQEAHDDEDSNIIFGAVIDDSLGDRIQITVIATGFDRTAELLQEQFGSEFAANRLTRDAPVVNAAGFSGALFREPAKVIKLGTIISEFADDGAYDIPTFIRNQADYK
jgi:cell division protein FtsZ